MAFNTKYQRGEFHSDGAVIEFPLGDDYSLLELRVIFIRIVINLTKKLRVMEALRHRKWIYCLQAVKYTQPLLELLFILQELVSSILLPTTTTTSTATTTTRVVIIHYTPTSVCPNFMHTKSGEHQFSAKDLIDFFWQIAPQTSTPRLAGWKRRRQR